MGHPPRGEPAAEPEDDTPAAVVDGELTRSMLPDIRAMGPNIVIAGILPFVVYAVIRSHLPSDAVALAAVMIFPVLEVTYERRRKGRFEPIGIIVLVGITLGLIGAVISGGNATLLKLRESVITGAFGVICLLSLPARRPMMWFLGREFATAGDQAKREAFDQIWDMPGSPRRFRLVTAVWGFGLLGEAVGRTILALSLSTGVFLVTSFALNALVLAGLFTFTAIFSRAAERRTRSEMERLGLVPPDMTALA
ncbi:MAG: VC0807 family protein [Acidimicrobiales bacterium]